MHSVALSSHSVCVWYDRLERVGWAGKRSAGGEGEHANQT